MVEEEELRKKGTIVNSIRFLSAAVVAAVAAAAILRADALYQDIAELKPIGFWPADEGHGARLRNLGSIDRDGLLFNTGWANGALDFNAAFQFVEIPRHPATLSPSFSLGTWVFVRRPRAGVQNDGRGTMLLGNWGRHWRKMPGPIMLRLTGREKRTIEVVSNRKRDVLGSKAAGIQLAPETWQHVLYTYQDGIGTLFVNGQKACSRAGVPYTPQTGEFLAGPDANWWALYPPRSEALDGSLAGIVMFDRAIGADEVATLVAARPATAPHVLAADELRLHGCFVKLSKLEELSPEDQRLAIRHMHLPRYGWVGSHEANADVLTTYLVQALGHPLLRYDAALLLEKMGKKQTIADAKPHLIETVGNSGADRAERATAALVLGRLGADAGDACETLRTALQADVAAAGTQIPKVEKVLRNALTSALIAIDGTGTDTRKLLGTAYAKPILDVLDLDQPYVEQVKAMVAEGRFMDALDACKPIIKEQKLYFRSQGDPSRDQREHWAGNSRAYTPVDEYNGYTYTFGNAKAFDGCAAITQADYDRAVAAYSRDFPEAATWMDGKVEGLFRADLKRTAPDGTVETAYMGGENFIFTGRDAKTKGWSVAVDKHGYIHAMGGQHNFPRYSEFMPGAWESLGLAKDRRNAAGPTTLYFVSKRPEDISEFEFVGRKGHPQDIPVPFMNYMNFVQDRNGELYLYGRNDSGIQNWAFYRYDAEARRWHDMGGERVDVISDIRQADPEWIESVEHAWIYCFRGNMPDGRGASEHGSEYPSLCWAWQPFFYNYIRATRGVQFDPDNRMYIEIPILGYDARKRMSESDQFVYSDDGGKTYHRADGSVVKLPLTCNPSPDHNADLLSGYSEIWFRQWSELIKRVGFIF